MLLLEERPDLARAAGRPWSVRGDASRKARCSRPRSRPTAARGCSSRWDGRSTTATVGPADRCGRRWPSGRHRRRRRGAAAAVHPRRAGRSRALPDRVRRPARIGGRAHRRAPPHRRPARRGWPERGVAVAPRRAGGRAGHVPARSPSTDPTTTGCTASATACPEETLEACLATSGAAAGSSPSAPPPCGPWRRRPPGELEGRTDLFIRPGLRVAAGRRADDELPPAPHDAAGDDRRLRRRPGGATCTPPRSTDGLPLPVLRRRHAPDPPRPLGSPWLERRCSRWRSTPPTGRHGPVGSTRPRDLSDAVLHAGRHPGAVQAPVARGLRRPRASRSCWATRTT